MFEPEKIKKVLDPAKNIVIVSHANPDGDAVGSCIAWERWLRGPEHNVTTIMPNDVPRFLKKMKGIETVRFFERHEAELTPIVERADAICCLDFNEIATRLGPLAPAVLANTRAPRILIDHHLDPPADQYAAVVSDAGASSTSYLVYKVIEALGGTDRIDPETAAALYTGMMTDTGNFSYGNLTPDTYRVVSRLVERGADPARINVEVFHNQTENRMRLLGFVLYRKMTVLPRLGAAYITLSRPELYRFGHKQGDTEGMVNYPMSIEGIGLSAIFIETTECIKISLRSQGPDAVDVNRFARRYFTGGGHRNAAGAKSFTGMDEAVRIFLDGLAETREEEKRRAAGKLPASGEEKTHP